MNASELLRQATIHHEARRFHEAEVIYRQLLTADAGHADAWHGLGLIALAAGQRLAGIDCFQRALTLQPNNSRFRETLLRCQSPPSDDVASLNSQGIAHAKAGRLPEALAAFQRAIELQPEHAGAHNNLGNVFKKLGRFDEAIQSITQAVRLDPTAADLHVNLGYLQRQMGRLDAAGASLRQALQLEPRRLDALKALASTLFDLGSAAEAVVVLRECLTISPHDADTLNDLGNALRQLERHDEAVTCYREALKYHPNLGAVPANLANLLSEEGKTDEARQLYEQAHRLRPSPMFRILSETQLPVIPDSIEQLESVRTQLSENLRRLADEGVSLDPTQELMPTHFYLAYHGRNDRDLHKAFARLGDGPRRLKIQPTAARKSGKIRVGFLSKYLRTHTIGQLNHGLIAGLSRDQFEVTVLSIGPPDEGLGRRIQQRADHFLVLPPQLGAALQTVAALGLDILHFPDIGMDAQSYTMAFSRMAPVQCVGWGHPVTTGLSTIDYFISSDTVEIPAADGHYTEKLVRLPRLGVCYERPVLPAQRKDRAAFGLPEHAHLYLCPQTLFKFHPEFDALLGGILRNDPAGLLVLIEGRSPHWTERIRQRFGRTLADVQHRIYFVPKQNRDDFLNLLAIADVMLDPIHFCGGNTSYEGFALGVPIVTWPSEFLRGRLTFAMYQQMGLLDLVAKDGEDYVRLAVRLGTDADYREAIRCRIREACGVLFEDVAAVRELERFFASVVK
ncbi:MAG: tetratricopeptide repeat protein [Planctomycetes bacterium]|nr:tetratricopeptide repeat protein [Planctomycetota bacterium]